MRGGVRHCCRAEKAAQSDGNILLGVSNGDGTGVSEGNRYHHLTDWRTHGTPRSFPDQDDRIRADFLRLLG